MSEERLISQGYEKVSTEEPSEGLVSCEADETELVSDELAKPELTHKLITC